MSPDSPVCALVLAGSFAASALAADSLAVRVLDPREGVVPNARVEARCGDGGSVSVATSGRDGVAAFDAKAPCEIMVQADGFEQVLQRIVAMSAGAVPVRLRPAIVRTSIDVVVRDEAPPGADSGSTIDIERTGARTVFDAVDRVVPGVFVTRRGVMGYGISTNGTGAISIRGIGGSPNTGVLIVVDGRPDYQGLMGHPLPDFYSLSDAGSVSVVEGPASVLYGSNAMGGVVEIRNWEPPEGRTSRLTVGYGSYNTGQYNLTHGARFRRSFYSINAGVAHTSGDRPGSAFRDQDGTVTAGYLSKVWRASIEGRYGHFHVEDPGPVDAPLANSYANVGRGGVTANLENTARRTWGYLRAYSSYGNHYLTDGFRSTDRTTGFRADQNIALLPQFTLEVGTDVVNFGGRARNAASHLDYGRHDITTAAGFTRAQWSATRRLKFHSGVRYESNSQAGSITAPEFGAAYRLADGYSVSADVARGFRNPTIRELYLFPAPNPALEPERVWNYQASFQAHPARTIAATVTAYRAELSNLVVTLGRYPNIRLLNAGSASNRGVEISGQWRAHRRIAMQSGYAYLRSTNLAPYLPAHKLTYSAEIDAGRAFVTFGAASVSGRWGDTRHSRKMGGYTLGTLKLTVRATRSWKVFAMVDNLFNRNYEVVPGYTMPGTSASGGISVNF